MEDKNNIIKFDGGCTKNITAEALRSMKDNLSYLIEYVCIVSKIQKAKYDSLKAEGFSDMQAIKLCKSIFS